MIDPQDQAGAPEKSHADFLVEALQRQRNMALDQLAQCETAFNMTQANLQVAQYQNKALNELNSGLIAANAAQEEELVELRAQNSVLTMKLNQHATQAQKEGGVIGSLMTMDNPPATVPPSPEEVAEAQAGEPSTARGSKS